MAVGACDVGESVRPTYSDLAVCIRTFRMVGDLQHGQVGLSVFRVCLPHTPHHQPLTACGASMPCTAAAAAPSPIPYLNARIGA